MNIMNLTATSLIVLVFIFLGLIVLAYFIFSKISKKASSKKYNKIGKKTSPGVCPVCATVLKQGESLITAIYPGKDDKLCYIYGCNHCYPVADEHSFRSCPVCGKELGADSYLIARYFIRRDNTERIHILGCTSCRFSKNKT